MDLDKVRVVARAFYNGDMGQYKSFEQALKEMTDENSKPSESFLNSCFKMNLKPKEGHQFFINDEGFVLSFRQFDGFVEPQNIEMDEDHERIKKLLQNEKFKDMSEYQILTECGFRVITPEPKENL